VRRMRDRRIRVLFVLAALSLGAFAHDARADVVVVSAQKATADYEAETYSGVPLDGAYAKARGVGKGLVWMAFEKQRRGAFRIAKEKVKRIVHLAADDVAPVMIVRAATTARTKIDVVDTADGIVAIETVTANAGIFTTSDVYVFAKGATLDQRIAQLGKMPPTTKTRLARALTLAANAR